MSAAKDDGNYHRPALCLPIIEKTRSSIVTNKVEDTTESEVKDTSQFNPSPLVQPNSVIPNPPPIPPLLDPFTKIKSSASPASEVSMSTVLELIQQYISSFTYNYTGISFFRLKKTGGTTHILTTVHHMIACSLPIQCVEAVFMAAVLTSPYNKMNVNGRREMVRIPLSFKSSYHSNIHRHIVLAVMCEGKWGALGMSRRTCLMYKPLVFSSLWALIEEFSEGYKSVGHILLTSYCGTPLPSKFDYGNDIPIIWKAVKLKMNDREKSRSRILLKTFLIDHQVTIASRALKTKSKSLSIVG